MFIWLDHLVLSFLCLFINSCFSILLLTVLCVVAGISGSTPRSCCPAASAEQQSSRSPLPSLLVDCHKIHVPLARVKNPATMLCMKMCRGLLSCWGICRQGHEQLTIVGHWQDQDVHFPISQLQAGHIWWQACLIFAYFVQSFKPAYGSVKNLNSVCKKPQSHRQLKR